MAKHAGGRPAKYKTEKDIQEAILSYFKYADENKRMYSKAGLLWKLDISRPVYANYKKKFPNAIRIAELAIEEDWVNRLSSTGATGAIFYLKNAFKEDYKDRTETDITSGNKPIPILNALSNNNSDKKDNGAEKKD